jgi:calcium-dependent protein kinase
VKSNCSCFNFSFGELEKSIKEGIFDLETYPWNMISNNAKDLVRRLLTTDPNLRIDSRGALLHPWIITPFKNKQINLKEVVNRVTEIKSMSFKLTMRLTRYAAT